MSTSPWRCMVCSARFQLQGSPPRLTVVAITVAVGANRITIDTPHGAWKAAICPECAVASASSLAQLERDGLPGDGLPEDACDDARY